MNSWSVASFLCLLGVAAVGSGCKGPEAETTTTAAAPSASAATSAEPAAAAEAPKGKDMSPIKVGILHSLSGTMAISETSLKDVALMTIYAINKKGGVLGRQLEPVVVDPASNWPLFAEKARELLQKDKVAVTFGCWTSVSRKSVLPVFEELNGLRREESLRISPLVRLGDWRQTSAAVQVAGTDRLGDATTVTRYGMEGF